MRRSFLLFMMSAAFAPALFAQNLLDDFFIAIANDRANDVRAMLVRGLDPNSVDVNGDPALVVAVRNGSAATVDVLLAAKADPDRRNRYGDTPMMVAALKGRVSQAAARHYATAFMTALSAMATPGRHANVLQHMAGYFQRLIDDGSRRELAASIADYQGGLVPLIVPITLVLHHARAGQVQYLLDQVYLQPHPKELMLRNHV